MPMLSDVRDYVAAVLREGWALIGGVSLSAGGAIWNGYVPDRINIPDWVLWRAFPALAVGFATFRAWQKAETGRTQSEAALRALRDTLPQAELKLVVDGSRLYLDVANRGAQAAFWLLLDVPLENGQSYRTLGSWEPPGRDARQPIGRGKRDRLLLANHYRGLRERTEAPPFTVTWMMFNHHDGTRDVFRAEPVRENEEFKFFGTLEMTLMSEPAPEGEPPTLRVELGDGYVRNELTCEQTTVVPETPAGLRHVIERDRKRSEEALRREGS
jgi:hypothetical protein